ncbi:MAG TPA: ChrR family anti-sigma-E factor [Rhizomicrobium sp.]|nr:ChrR family anti-sigma-E factor [Rhizomicrobium sp.]
MSIRHHPEEALLLAHAAGSLDPAMALILATHLHFCAACRAQAALGDMVGGALLEEAQPAPLAADALARTLARLDTPAAPMPRAASNDNTPPPLRAFLGGDLSAVRWRAMGPQLGYRTLYRQGGLALRLLRGSPGSDIGSHSHRGQEYTLVLKGGYRDETGAYGPGDFQAAGGDITHNPVADPGEDCINLAVTIGGLRFKSAGQNLVARLFGF